MNLDPDNYWKNAQNPVTTGASDSSAVLGEWSSIDTAPTDGTYVLVSNGRGVWVAAFKAVFQSGWKPDCPWQSMMLNHDHIPRAKRNGPPTHWMPLPEAPNAVFSGADKQ